MAVPHLGRRVYVPETADDRSASFEVTVSRDHRCLPSPALEADNLRPRRLSQVSTLSPLPVIHTSPVSSTGSLSSHSPSKILAAVSLGLGRILATGADRARRNAAVFSHALASSPVMAGGTVRCHSGPSEVGKVWSQNQIHPVSFPQSRICIKSGFFYQNSMEVCVGCF